MSPDDTIGCLERMKALWPNGRWTPAACKVWISNLETLDRDAGSKAILRIGNRSADPPAWSEVLAEARALTRLEQTTTTDDSGPSLTTEAHLNEIFRLREAFPFISKHRN